MRYVICVADGYRLKGNKWIGTSEIDIRQWEVQFQDRAGLALAHNSMKIKP